MDKMNTVLNSPEAATALKVASMNPSAAAAIKVAKMSIPVVNKFADTAMPFANKFAASAMPFANKFAASANNFLQKASTVPEAAKVAPVPEVPTDDKHEPPVPEIAAPTAPEAPETDKPEPPEISFLQQITNRLKKGDLPSLDFLPPFPAAEVLKIASSFNNLVQDSLENVKEYSKVYIQNETAKMQHTLDMNNALAEEAKNADLKQHVDKYIDHLVLAK